MQGIRRLFVPLCFMLGGYLIAESGWIHAKAVLAQELIEQAWQQSLEQGEAIKPWPWADTWPVGRLQADAHGVDLYVLHGDHGSALAFGPGQLSLPDSSLGQTPVVLAGHRDTHFRFMQQLKHGDQLRFTGRSGQPKNYRLVSLAVEDSSQQSLSIDLDDGALILVTCYPFDAVMAGGPLRYVARAVPENNAYQL
jgi:sortase A